MEISLFSSVNVLKSCDDRNACTFDWMDAEEGCQHDEITCEPCHTHQTTPPTDFVFLWDISRPINQTRLGLSTKALNMFRKLIAEDPSRIGYRFLTAAFDADMTFPVITQHFTRSVSFQRPDYLYKGNSNGIAINSGNMNANSVENHLLASLGALNQTLSHGVFSVIAASTESIQGGMDISMVTEENIEFQENADIHVILLSDLQETNNTQKHLSDGFNDKSLSVLEDIMRSIKGQPMSIGVFFDIENEPANQLWGDPSLANVYSNMCGFNKAFTLKALIRAGKIQASSLQAHALSQGIELRTFDINQLQDIDCIRHMYAGYVQSVGIKPKFCNKCKAMVRPCNVSVGCQIEKVSCPGNHFCSPTHGCVRNLKQGNGTFVSKMDSEFINTSVPTDSNFSWIHSGVVQGHVPVLEWHPDKPFANWLIQNGKPVILKNALPSKWPALKKWNMEYLSDKLGETLTDVKHTINNERLTYDPDKRAPMSNFSSIHFNLPYTIQNMTSKEFFTAVVNDSDNGYYYFTSMVDRLKPDVSPHNLLFVSEEDLEEFKQFLWVSSTGMITHTHFDQDYNFFVQVYGEKEFALWEAPEHVHMHMFPRVHPMWHKSRVNVKHPDPTTFPRYRKARALKAKLYPGDLLYVPPYTWHRVISNTRSISLSTYSHDYSVYDHMNSVYRHDHKFDLLSNKTGQMYVLRLYLDLMIQELVGSHGNDQTTSFFSNLLETRYSQLEHLFPVSPKDKRICKSRVKNKIPTAQHVVGYAKLDAKIVAPHFRVLRPEVRDILFADYVEEISAQVVGAEKLLAFFRYCFVGQTYYLTAMDDDEHALWDHKDDAVN